MQAGDMTGHPTRLPVWNSFRRVLHIARHGAWAWVKLAAAPFLAQLVTLFAVQTLLPASPRTEMLILATGLLYVPAATAWIRGIGAERVRPRARYRWRGNEVRYLERYLALMVAVAVLAAGLSGVAVLARDGRPQLALIGWIGVFPALVSGMGLLLWLLAPALMMLPAAACGEDDGLGAARRLARGEGWRIVAIGYLTSVALLLCLVGLVALLWVVQFLTLLLLIRANAIALLDTALPLLVIGTVVVTQAVAASLSTLLHATALGWIHSWLKHNAGVPPG
jgi:hypothetical protein